MRDPAPDVREWVIAVAHLLDLDDVLGAGVDDPDNVDDVVEKVLALTADVAHGVSRPAAPVTAFLVGLAAGRAADPRSALAGRLDAVSAFAATWPVA